MCGICGFLPALNPDEQQNVIRAMCHSLRHRGPDDEGFYSDANVCLGMRRLSIIDLSTGHQPISNEDGSVWLVFNGEIYNFRQLRVDLEKRGHRFTTATDTEVIVHAYEEYGVECVELFNGMFAFAIWDSRAQKLVLARDRLGIKPLYYWQGPHQLVFGSELKALLKHPQVPRNLDPVALDQFLTLEYIPAPRTIFRDIRKLPAGHLLIHQSGHTQLQQYWDVKPIVVPQQFDDCVARLDELIEDAVRLRMVSDVPIGAFLSGGIDSSTIVSKMSQLSDTPIRSFSIGFDDSTYNELPYAQAVAQHFETIHREAILKPDIAGFVDNLASHMDEPLGDFSIFPTYLVSQVARESVKVILSGDGGDEVFGGYDTYVAQTVDRYYRFLPATLRQRYLPALGALLPPQPGKKGFINKTKRFIEGAGLDAGLQHTRWMLFMHPQEKAQLYSSSFGHTLNGSQATQPLEDHFRRSQGWDPLAQQQYVDVKTYLAEDILTKVDRMSMAVSLEVRVPLLDHRIVEFALSLPPEMKLARGQTKIILRQVMQQHLPQAVLTRPKQGFSIPIKQWLSGPLKPIMTDLLAPEPIRRDDYFDAALVQRWVNEHLDGRANHSHRLWALMSFQLWRQHYLEVVPHGKD